MRWTGALLVFAACNSGGNAMVDGGADAPTDGQREPGVVVRWTPSARLPGPVITNVSVSNATFSVNLFEVVSPQGHDELERFDLEWSDDKQPTISSLPDAPPGDYQVVKVKLDSVELRGTWTNNGDQVKYRIETKFPFFTKQLPLAKTLDAGGSLPLSVGFDVGAALAAVNFALLAPHGGGGGGDDDDQGEDEDDVELEDGDPQMVTFRTAMFAGISLGD